MDLDQFIESTLTSIIKGVAKAEEFAKANGGRINPVPIRLLSTPGEPHYVYYGNDEGVKPLTKISFDLKRVRLQLWHARGCRLEPTTST